MIQEVKVSELKYLMLGKNRQEIILDNEKLDDGRSDYLVALQDIFLPIRHGASFHVESPTVPLSSIGSSGSPSGSPGHFYWILAPEQYHMRMPFTNGRGFYSLTACLRVSCPVVA